MTKAEILDFYKDINYVYNNPYMLRGLEYRIDSMIMDWLDSFDTSSATKCFEAVNILKETLENQE